MLIIHYEATYKLTEVDSIWSRERVYHYYTKYPRLIDSLPTSPKRYEEISGLIKRVVMEYFKQLLAAGIIRRVSE